MTITSDVIQSLKSDTLEYIKQNVPSVLPTGKCRKSLVGDSTIVVDNNQAWCIRIQFRELEACVTSKHWQRNEKMIRSFKYGDPEFPQNMYEHITVRSAIESCRHILQSVRQLGSCDKQAREAAHADNIDAYRASKSRFDMIIEQLTGHSQCVNNIDKATNILTRWE